MAAVHLLRRRDPTTSTTTLLKTLTRLQASSFSSRSLEPHEYKDPCDFLGSWTPPANPKDAQRRLALLRNQYKRQVKEVRTGYIFEVAQMREEKMRKDEAKWQKLRAEMEARKAEKAAASESRAAERKVQEEEFRKILEKERADRLAYWKTCEAKREQKKIDKKELIRRQSSIWIDEKDLHKRALDALINYQSL